MTKRYVKTDGEACGILGINRVTFFHWKKASDFRVVKGAKGWPMEALFAYQRERKARDLRTRGAVEVNEAKKEGKKARIPAAGLTIREQKLTKEIELIDERLAEIRREVIPMAEHLDMLRLHATMAIGVLSEWVSWVTAYTHDAAQVDEAERMRDKFKARMTEEVGKV